MLSLRKILVVFNMLCLSACGFSPVHQNYGGRIVGAEAKLAAIKVDVAGEGGNRIEQMLSTNLKRELNLSSVTVKELYKLHISVTSSLSNLGVKKDKEITRYNIIYSANYTLKDLATDEKITNGKSRIVGGYDAVSSDFGTYAAKKDIEGRIMSELAKDIKLRLTSYFLGKKKARNENYF